MIFFVVCVILVQFLSRKKKSIVAKYTSITFTCFPSKSLHLSKYLPDLPNLNTLYSDGFFSYILTAPHNMIQGLQVGSWAGSILS